MRRLTRGLPAACAANSGGIVVSVDLQTANSLAEGGVTLSRLEHGYWHESARRLARDRIAIACTTILLLLTVLALAAPLISKYVTHFQPTDQDLLHTFQGPTGRHWLGTDELGRDTLTRLAWGARVTLGVSVLCVAVQLLIGVSVGMVAGFYGGAADMVSMRAVDSVLGRVPGHLPLHARRGTFVRPTPVTMALHHRPDPDGQRSLDSDCRAEILTLKNEDHILALSGRSVPCNARLMVGHIFCATHLRVIIVIASVRVGQVAS